MTHQKFIDNHAETVSRAKLVLIVICIVAIVASFVWTKLEVGSTNSRITKVESPCLRYGSQSKECHESFQAAIDSITDYQLCVLLSKRPDLTQVDITDCRQTARDQHQRGTDVIGRSPTAQGRRSPDLRPSKQPPGNQPEVNSAPTGHGGSEKPETDHPDATLPQPQNPKSPEQTNTPPSLGTAPSSPDNVPAGSSVGSASPPSTSVPELTPSEPPIVGIKVPTLPAQACVPGVVGVNCGR